MLGEGGLNLFLTIKADNSLNLDVGEIIVSYFFSALWAESKSSSGHMWPLGLSFPTSDLDCGKTLGTCLTCDDSKNNIC